MLRSESALQKCGGKKCPGIHFGHEFLTFMVICFQNNVFLSVQRIENVSIQRHVAMLGLRIFCKSGLLWLLTLGVKRNYFLRVTCGVTKRLQLIEPYTKIYFLTYLSVDVCSNENICE